MRSRPDIVELVVTSGATPGSTFDVRVVLKSASDTPINSITLRLVGTERFRAARNQPAGVIRPILDLRATLQEGGSLTEGTHTFKARFKLPPDATPSYTGTSLFVDYLMTVHVDIPWWPDRRQAYTIVVSHPRSRRPPRAPLTQTTARGDDKPFLELSVDDTVLAPGDVLSGALALGNLRGRKVKGLQMALITVEKLAGSPAMRGAEFPVHFGPNGVHEGREFPFRFTLDKSLQPALRSPALSVSYVLEVRAEFAWNKDLVHAAYITLAAMDEPQPGVRSRPRLGAPRWRRAWEEAGAKVGLSLADPDELRLTGTIYNSNVSVFIDPDADEPSFVAQIDRSSMELGLRIKLKTLSFLASKEGDDRFSQLYKVQGREPAQVRALCAGPLRKALLAFEEVYVDDKQARVRSKAKGMAEPFIGEFVELAADLARRLAEAGARVPPPAAMTEALPFWRAFADEARAELLVGSMCARGGRIDGARFDIDTFFDGDPAPRKTVITLLPDPPLPEALDASDPDTWAKAAPGSREIAAEVSRGALALRVTPHAIELDLEAPLLDPGALRPRMELMLALARRLRGEKAAGPYR